MNIKDFEIRQKEFEEHNNIIHDKKPIEELKYAILGGKNHFIIKDAIKRVFAEQCNKFGSFLDSEEFKNSKEDQEAYKENHIAYESILTTAILIELLKKDEYLRKELGEDEEQKLYEDFYIYDDEGLLYNHNPISILFSCFLKYLSENYGEEWTKEGNKELRLIKQEFNMSQHGARLLIGKNITPQSLINRNDKKTEHIESFLSTKSNRHNKTNRAILQSFNNEYGNKLSQMSHDEIIHFFNILNLANNKKNNRTYTYIDEENDLIKFEMSPKETFEFFDFDGKYHTNHKYYGKKTIKKLFHYQKLLTEPYIKAIGHELIWKNPPLYTFEIRKNTQLKTTRCCFSTNTHFLEDPPLINYIRINMDEYKKIETYREEYWANLIKQVEKEGKSSHTRLIKHYLRTDGIIKAAPIKFNIMIKTTLHKNRKLAPYHIKDTNLNIWIGDIDSAIIKILRDKKHDMDKKNKSPKNSKTFREVRLYVLKYIFYCATKCKWIIGAPIFYSQKQIWEFRINTLYSTGKPYKKA